MNNKLILTATFLALTTLGFAHELGPLDPLVQASLLRCVGPIVQYTTRGFRPEIGGPLTAICDKYEKYRLCAAPIPEQERAPLVGPVEAVYDFICQEDIRQNLTDQRQCFSIVQQDLDLRECQANVTSAVKNFVSNLIQEDDNSTDSSELSLCSIMQQYLDCLIARDFMDQCADALELERQVLERLVNNCTLVTAPALPVWRVPSCSDASGVCTCRSGYVFNTESKLCEDIDECSQEVGLCSQRCVNTRGSYECKCDDRYYSLHPDEQKTCVRTDPSPVWIFFAHGQSIWNISEDGKDFQLQRAALQKTAMIDLDIKEKRLYYADIGANKLERIELSAAFSDTIQDYEVDGMEGIAVDWVGRNLYTVRQKDMFVQSLDGKFRRTLYSKVFKLPRALAVYPAKGYAFASDWGAQAFIGRAALDGSKFERLITEGIVWPNGIAVDYYTDKLYWADAFLDTIEMSDLDGGNRRTVVSDAGSVPHVFGLAVADDYVYWTDWTYRGILRGDKVTGANVTVLAQTALLPYGLKVFHSAMQPELKDACPAGEKACSQLCLLQPATAASDAQGVCACSDGFELDKDGFTCVAACWEKQIECGGEDPRCISKRYLCDGVQQCKDGVDESQCPNRVCAAGQFQCHDGGKCLNEGNVCDGNQQCPDGSDEAYC